MDTHLSDDQLRLAGHSLEARLNSWNFGIRSIQVAAAMERPDFVPLRPFVQKAVLTTDSAPVKYVSE